MRRAHASRRSGFTLIEMLVVIMIILLLVGLLLPAVQKARDAAMRAQVKSEIANIGTGIENFKTTYDVKYIPTFFILSSNYNVAQADPQYAAMVESREFYSKVWPKGFLPGNPGLTPLNPQDVIRIQMDGNQLLTFLLGGVPPTGALFGPSWQGTRSGFLNSPTNPFNVPIGQKPPAQWTENYPPQANMAKGPFFDFQQRRVDNNGHFHDPYWRPVNDPADPTYSFSVYYYFSSKNGNDYDYWGQRFVAAMNPSNNPYGPTPYGGYGAMNPHIGLDGKYIEPNGYQIVSAGKDQVPGAGRAPFNTPPGSFNQGDYVWPGSGSYKVSRTFPPNPPPPPYDPTGGGADDLANFSPYVLGSDR